jgi:hypothetical protein
MVCSKRLEDAQIEMLEHVMSILMNTLQMIFRYGFAIDFFQDAQEVRIPRNLRVEETRCRSN